MDDEEYFDYCFLYQQGCRVLLYIVESKEESVYYYEHVKFKPTSHADDVHMLMIRKTEFA